MSNFAFNEGLLLLANGDLDLDGIDLRVLLCKELNDVKANPDAVVLSDLSLDEYAGSGYVRVAVTGMTLAWNDAERRVELLADNPVFSTLGPDVTPAVGALYFLHLGADSLSKPLFWHDQGGWPKNGTGQDFTLVLSPAGIATLRRGQIV